MCKENYSFISDSIYKHNCYQKCQYYYYFNETNNYICTENCSGIYNKLIIEKKRCIDKCQKDDAYKYEYNNICFEKCPNGTILNQENYVCIEEQNIQTTIIFTNDNCNGNFITDIKIKNVSINFILESNIISESFLSQETIRSDDYNTIKTNSYEYFYNIDIYNNEINETIFEYVKQNLLNDFNKVSEDNDLQLETKNILITMTNTHNQKYNINKYKTTINLGDCESNLKKFYNISNNESLYIFKIDKIEEGMKIPKIEYEVYYPLNAGILTKLDLTICKYSKIDISIPVKIDDDIKKYNSSSDYYNNICSKTTSKSGTDISLNDRRNQFKENNMSLCEENCYLVEYNYTTKKAKCSCLIKINFPLMDEIKFDKDKLYKSFIDINNIANIQIMKCGKYVFNIKSLSKNYGFFIYIFIFILFFLCLFLFYYKYFSSLKKVINKITKRDTFKINDNINKTDNIDMGKIQNIIVSKDINNQKEEPEIKNKKLKMKKSAKKKFKGKTLTPQIKEESVFNSKGIINFPNDIMDNPLKVNKEEKKEILIYNDNELNSFDYKKALIYDKRTFTQYYISLLRINHLLLFSFYIKNRDYNSQIIKMFLFFFFFSVHFTINALFFNDDTMHTIFIDEGSFNFIYQIPQIIYSSLISGVINIIINYLALSEKIILEIKKVKEIKDLDEKVKDIFQILKIKVALFFVIAFALLLTFMYYIACFCGIYENTQIHLIKDTLISFGLSLIYPFGIYLIPGIFRITALRAKNKDKEYLYKFSKFIGD